MTSRNPGSPNEFQYAKTRPDGLDWLASFSTFTARRRWSRPPSGTSAGECSGDGQRVDTPNRQVRGADDTYSFWRWVTKWRTIGLSNRRTESRRHHRSMAVRTLVWCRRSSRTSERRTRVASAPGVRLTACVSVATAVVGGAAGKPVKVRHWSAAVGG
jgi:hypothetical protein